MSGKAPSTRDRLLEFELELDALVCDEVVAHEWGRAFLTPSLPLVWDANWVLIERPGLAADEMVAIADAALAGCDHRTVAFLNEADEKRLAEEIAALPGWEAERAIFMVWEGWPESEEQRQRVTQEVAELPLARFETLRRQLHLGEMAAIPNGEAISEQLLEMDHRYGRAAGDRWFVAPAAEPASACRLLSRGGELAQVEEVATLAAARERGLARATVEAAILAAQGEGAGTIFLTADVDDWPQVFYSRLGFAPTGGYTVFRRKPS
jgi:GNAT superfamily N-acetyltransferase